MDKKALFQAIIWSLAVFFLAQMVVLRIWPPPKPTPPGPSTTTPPASVTTPTEAGSTDAAAPSAQKQGTAGAPATGVGSSPAVPASKPAAEAAKGGLTVRGASTEDTFVLGTVEGGKKSPYRLEMRLTNRGAAIDSVLLSDYRLEVDGEERYPLVSPAEAGKENLRSLTLAKIVVDEQELPLDRVLWRGQRGPTAEGDSASFACEVLDEQGQPLLRLTRRYTLPPVPWKERRYDFTSELTVENLTDAEHVVRLTERGPVGVRREDRRMDDRRFNVGLYAEGVVQKHKPERFSRVSKDGGDVKLYTPQDEARFWWATAENKYFAFIIAPLTATGKEGPDYVYEVAAVDLDGDEATTDDVTLRLVMGPLRLGPGQARTLRGQHYAGPKDRAVFLSDANPTYQRRDYIMLNQDALSWCTFGWLTEFMVVVLNAFQAVVRNYGIAIFLLVLLVRIALHPITKRTQVNMVKMQQSMGKLQPKLEEAKKRFGNDKQRLQTETMRIYKEAGVSPLTSMFSCLPMALQMPIWIALYTSLNNNIAMRHQGFIWWIKDLTAPDALIHFAGSYHVPLISSFVGEITSFNLLPLFLAVTMYAQQKLMPKPKPMTSGSSEQGAQMQQQMQAMMPLMSVFFALIFYNMPSGLNLYIMTSSLFGALEQWHIRKHVEQTKESGEAVKALPGDSADPKAHPPRFVDRLLKMADEAQKLKSNRKS